MTVSAPASVIVVDDHPLFRRGVVELLNSSDNFYVMEDYSSALKLKDSLASAQPDLLLLDLQMPDMSGLEALQQLKPHYRDVKIVILTASTEKEQLLDTIRSGADGYLMKDSEPDEILGHLDNVLQGKVAMNDIVVNALAHSLRDIPEPITTTIDSMEGMTEREQQTLNLIAQGMNNKLIARELGISDGTVKVYVKNLLRKLNLHSRLELAAWAHSHFD